MLGACSSTRYVRYRVPCILLQNFFLLVKFVNIGHYFINLSAVTYAVREGDKLLVFFCKSTDMSVTKAGDRIDLSGDEATQFEEILRTLKGS